MRRESGIDDRFKDPEGQEAALLPPGRERDVDQGEHVLGLERRQFGERPVLNMLAQEGGGGLADDAPAPLEISGLNPTVSVEAQIQADPIATDGVPLPMGAGRIGEPSPVVGRLVMGDQVGLIDWLHDRAARQDRLLPIILPDSAGRSARGPAGRVLT